MTSYDNKLGLCMRFAYAARDYQKQAGVAAWFKCWLSHLDVAGSSPGYGSKVCKFKRTDLRQNIRGVGTDQILILSI